jgi:hypothetical protein
MAQNQLTRTDMKKAIAVCIATIVATCAEIYFLGINGLTCVSIPLTIYLGIEVIEKITQKEETI